MATASSFTCISCHVVFKGPELQRQHYKSEWHRYNLKRKVAELPPVTAEEFQQRLQAQRNAETESQNDEDNYCEHCRKSFSNINSYNNHLKSKKHQESAVKVRSKSEVEIENAKNRAKNMETRTPRISEIASTTRQVEELDISEDDEDSSESEDDSEWESVDDEEDDDFEDGDLSPTECLFCDHPSETIESNLGHMTQQHSFFIPDIEYLVDPNGLLTYLACKVGAGHICLWCGEQKFRSTKSVQQHMVDKGHCKILHEGEALLEYADFYDYSSSYPEGYGNGDADEEVDVPILDGDDWELRLPSGAVIGHRSLARYYRQNLPQERAERNRNMIKHVMSQYSALGWTGTTTEQAVVKARDLKFMRKVQAKQALKLGVRANKLQRHFRAQVMF